MRLNKTTLIAAGLGLSGAYLGYRAVQQYDRRRGLAVPQIQLPSEQFLKDEDQITVDFALGAASLLGIAALVATRRV